MTKFGRRGGTALRIDVPWIKELKAPFHFGPFYIFGGLFFALTSCAFVLMSLDGGMSLTYLGLLIWGLTFTVLLWYPDIVWRISARRGVNKACFEDGAVRVAKSGFRDPSALAPAYFLLMYVGHLLIMVDLYVLKDSEEPRLTLIAHPIVNVLFLVFCVIAIVRMFTVKPVLEMELVLSPERIRVSVGRLNLMDIPWEDIVGFSIGNSGSRGEKLMSFLSFETYSEYKVKRGILFDPIGGETRFDLKSYDTEPNAIVRVVKEFFENPEKRAVLGTPEGVDFVTYGPSWNEVRKLKVGAEWGG